MDPIKYLLKLEIVNKCGNCQDLSFCKLPKMCQQIELPDIRDVDYIRKCLFYKKIQDEKIFLNSW